MEAPMNSADPISIAIAPYSSPSPVVSVIIVGFNTAKLLENCLRSVYLGGRGIEMEIIYVDNASDDGSVDKVRRYFPGVIIIENKENQGFVVANNQAMTIARGRYILLLNSDTIVLNDMIPRLVAFADLNQDGASFGCKVLNPDGTTQKNCFMSPSLLNMFLFATYSYKLFPRSRFFGRQMMTWWDGSDSREVETVSGCCALVRKAAIDEIGMMDPAYFFYGDDLDWCYRFRKAGWKVLYTPSASVIHYGGQSTRYMRRAFRLQLFGATLLFLKIHRGRAALLSGSLLTALFFALRCPYWLLRSILPGNDSRASLAEAITCAQGLSLSLFNWKGLLINRTTIEERLK